MISRPSVPRGQFAGHTAKPAPGSSSSMRKRERCAAQPAGGYSPRQAGHNHRRSLELCARQSALSRPDRTQSNIAADRDPSHECLGYSRPVPSGRPTRFTVLPTRTTAPRPPSAAPLRRAHRALVPPGGADPRPRRGPRPQGRYAEAMPRSGGALAQSRGQTSSPVSPSHRWMASMRQALAAASTSSGGSPSAATTITWPSRSGANVRGASSQQ